MTATRTPASSVQSPSRRSLGRTGNRWSALIVLMFGTFMFVLDFFIVNVALPSIQQGLGAGESAIEWIVAGYGIGTAVLLVTGGRLGDQFGRRRVFALGMALFVVTSAACALAPDPAVLVAARVAQGVGAALMVVVPLVDGRQAGWPVWSWVALSAAVPLAIAFAVHQRRKADRGGVPLLNPRVFAAWPLRAGLITQTVFWCQQAASYLVLGLYLQQGRGLSALAAGAVFTFLAAGYLITSFQAPALTVRFGRRVIAVGAVLAAAGDAALYLATDHGGSVAWLFPGLLLLGAEIGRAHV